MVASFSDSFNSAFSSMAKLGDMARAREAEKSYSDVLSQYAAGQQQKQMQAGVDETLGAIGEAGDNIGTMASKQSSEINSLNDQIKLYTDLAKVAADKGKAGDALKFHDEINNLRTQFADQKIKALALNRSINGSWGDLATGYLADPTDEGWINATKQAMDLGLPGAEKMLQIRDPEQRMQIARAQQATALGTAKSIDQEIKLAKEEETKRWHDMLDANQDENRKLRESEAAVRKELGEARLEASRAKQIQDLDIKRQQLDMSRERLDLAKAKEDKKASGEDGPDYKLYDTLEEKLNDPEYGVAKEKVNARDKVAARRVTTDTKEVLSSVDQILQLTKGGLKHITTGTFADVKVKGFTSAVGKELTNTITSNEEQIYDSMLRPLAKAMAMYQNPDYRPNQQDVQNAMDTYRASKGQTHEVQLEKLAILKRNFINETESFLDTHFMNAPQAANLKQQIRKIETAIPWEVGDVTAYVQSGSKKTFDQFLKDKVSGKSGVPEVTIKLEKGFTPSGEQDKNIRSAIKAVEEGRWSVDGAKAKLKELGVKVQ